MHTEEFDISKISDDNAFVVIIDEDIHSKEQLLEILNERMKFPYFGFNWDALHDVMRDFEWIKQSDIYLIHRGEINLPINDLKIYKEIMQDVLIFWSNDEEHKFHISLEVMRNDIDFNEHNNI